MLAIGAAGLVVILFGLVQVPHEQVALSQFLVDLVIQMTTHVSPPWEFFTENISRHSRQAISGPILPVSSKKHAFHRG
jgi:hypothetical protein